jgi:signal peptidase I
MPFAPNLFSGRIFARMPHRGDVIVFRETKDTSVDYVKRLIGLPGDKVQMKQGQLYINGTLVPRTPVGDYEASDESGTRVLTKEYRESLPDGPTHDILKYSDEERFDVGSEVDANNTPEYTVPPGDLFFMGDNRDNSSDSRFMNDLGFVPAENLVGRAQFIFFSFDASSPWWQIWMWPFEVRWSRLLMGVR